MFCLSFSPLKTIQEKQIVNINTRYTSYIRRSIISFPAYRRFTGIKKITSHDMSNVFIIIQSTTYLYTVFTYVRSLYIYIYSAYF